MAQAVRKPTMVALRSQHEAFGIAVEVLRGKGIDVEKVKCGRCGELLEPEASSKGMVFCRKCGHSTELPEHLRYRPIAEDSESAQPWYETRWDLTPVRAPLTMKKIVWALLFCLFGMGALAVSLLCLEW